MLIRRLGWAGLEIEADGERAVVDLLQEREPVPGVGRAEGPLPGPRESGRAATALVTHLHADHADPPAIAAALRPGDGLLLRPAPAPDGPLTENGALASAEAGLADRAIPSQSVAPWETVRRGPFAFTALPAVDGLGDPQVSWAIEAGGVRILHAGDTMLHGWWWRFALRLGAFDAAFVPINGARLDIPIRRPASPYPAMLDPEQGATAAALLGARLVVPIHYGAFDEPPVYVPEAEPLPRFLAAAESAGVEARVLEPGEELELAPAVV